MPEYKYQAKQGPEKLVEGIVDAPTEMAALEKISSRGFVPVRITLHERNGRGIVLPGINIGAQSHSGMFLFSSHLGRMIKAGVPILKAIHLLTTHEKDPKMREVLEAVERNIREGKTLARAMELYPSIFSPMFISVIRAGELSGSLQVALTRMALYFKKQAEFSSRVRRAMAYPAVLMMAGILSIFFIITFLVPRLEKVFAGLGHELPLATRFVLKLGLVMHHYWIFILIFMVLCGFLVPRLMKTLFGKDYLDSLKVSLPFLGPLTLKVEFSRFSRVLELCVSSGLSFLEALRAAIPAVNNKVIRTALEDCYRDVEKGSTFGQALKKHTLFPELTTSLLSIGEESGRVEETLTEIADVYEEEADEILLYSTTFLEPFMILFVGGIIGFIVIAVLLPIFEMNAVF